MNRLIAATEGGREGLRMLFVLVTIRQYGKMDGASCTAYNRTLVILSHYTPHPPPTFSSFFRHDDAFYCIKTTQTFPSFSALLLTEAVVRLWRFIREKEEMLEPPVTGISVILLQLTRNYIISRL
jgi:hypothetical protein